MLIMASWPCYLSEKSLSIPVYCRLQCLTPVIRALWQVQSLISAHRAQASSQMSFCFTI